MANFPFVVGDSLQIGTATISATGNAIVLPSGTQVGSTPVATTQEVATGGGPKITNLQITDNSWTVLDDTAVDTAGGYVLITGTNFVSGALVYFNQTAANSVAFVSATTLRVTVPALTAGTYIVYVINPDGGTAIRVPGLTASANPAWQTGSALPEQYDGVAITLNLVATDATSYTITSGSLPPGLSLNTSTGAISGTVTGVTVDTVYTFTVRATDAQLQDSPRTFTVTITVSDPYFKLTTLLLSGSAVSANTVVRDSSTNNFNLTVSGDARASNFTPYGTGWSAYFDGTGDYLTVPYNAAFSIPGDFTIEFWMYATNFPASTGTAAQSYARLFSFGTYNAANSFGLEVNSNDSGNLRKVMSWFNGTAYSLSGNNAVVPSIWYHIAVVRNGTTITCYLNGSITGTIASASATINTSQDFYIASLHAFTSDTSACFAGYLSNFRIIKGTALYTANFTPATTTLTAVANTSLLTCHVNRFLDGSTNNFAITRNGDARIVSFNPFNITNTGVDGSMYFDGTGDNVLVPTSANSIITGNSNFTLELWVFVTGAPGTYHGLFGGGSNDFTFSYSSQSSWGLYIAKVGLPPFIYTGMTVYNNLFQRWSHLAVTKNGTTWTIWVNGNSAVSVTDAVTFTNTQKAMGSQLGSDYMQGYISNVRYTAEVVYTNAFTPPTAPLTAIANTQLLTLQYDQPHNNHTFLDSSSNQFLITRSGNASQGTFSPFSQSGWSVYINNGTSSQIRISDNAALRIGTSAFNIEAWVYPTGFGEPFYVLRKRVNGNLGAGTWAFTVATNGSVLLEQVQGPATIAQTSAGLVALNTWTHVAVSRDSSNNVKIFVNGTIQATATSSYNFNDASNPISLLCDYDGRNASSIGYASNLRFVIGSAVYTANFTPATSNLTSSSQGAVAADVKILTFQDNRFRDASTNNFSITISGSPSVQAFSPFAATAVYNPVAHGGSAYFDGTGDYLTVPHDPAVVLNNEDWTIEFWVYPTVDARADLICKGNGASYVPYQVILLPSGQINFNASNNGSNHAILLYSNTGDYRLFQWNHIAVTKSGSTIRIFCQGALVATGSYSGGAMTNSLPLGIGAGSDGVQRLTGYMSNVRIIKGIALYTSAFTVPTAPPSPTTNTSLLLNCTDAAILDSTGRTVLETVADAKTSSVVTKFAGGSMSFDGTGDRLATVFSPLQDLSIGNWTIEFWLNLGATIPTTYRSICGASNGGGNLPKWAMIMNANTGYTYQANRLMFATYNGADRQINVAVTWASNTWYHIAVVHNNGTTALYLDGSSQGTIAFNIASGITGAIRIGADGEGYSDFTGYISDFRITRGYARYTANFTAPTAPHRLK